MLEKKMITCTYFFFWRLFERENREGNSGLGWWTALRGTSIYKVAGGRGGREITRLALTLRNVWIEIVI
jgi:hypothetical protein